MKLTKKKFDLDEIFENLEDDQSEKEKKNEEKFRKQNPNDVFKSLWILIKNAVILLAVHFVIILILQDFEAD